MFIYLASPYTVHGDHTEEEHTRIRAERFEHICKKAAELMKYGHQVFCPIAHSHPIEVLGMTEREGHDFWLKQDFAVLEHVDALYVYAMDGWEKSRGIADEIKFAEAYHIPVFIMFESGEIVTYGQKNRAVA